MGAREDIEEHEALRRWLAWQVAMGADEAIAASPIDRMARDGQDDKRPASIPATSAPVHADSSAGAPRAPREGARDITPPATDMGSIDATAGHPRPEDCHTLEEIRQALDGLKHFPLRRTASHTVFTDGDPAARVLLVGEAPGREEDRTGRPFVGRAGQLLDRMLHAAGLSRTGEAGKQAVLITNVLFWRPPGNRKPTEAELAFCQPWLERTIEIVRPDVIVCLGGTPTQRLAGNPAGILRQRGKWQQFATARMERPIALLPMLHPAYLLRQPLQKRLAWRDWLTLRHFLDERPAMPANGA